MNNEQLTTMNDKKSALDSHQLTVKDVNIRELMAIFNY